MKKLIYRQGVRDAVKAMQGLLAGLLIFCLLSVRYWTGEGGLGELGRSFERTDRFMITVEEIIRNKIAYVRNKELFERDGAFDENKVVDIRQYSSGVQDEANLNVNTSYYLGELIAFARDGADDLERRIHTLQNQGRSEQEAGEILGMEYVQLETILPVSGATLADYSRMSTNPAVSLLNDYRDLYETAQDILERYDRYMDDSGTEGSENSPDAPGNVLYYVENTNTKERYTNLNVNSMTAARDALGSNPEYSRVFEGERKFNIMVANTGTELNEEAARHFMNTRFVGTGEKVLIAAALSYPYGDALAKAAVRHEEMRPKAVAGTAVAVICGMLLPVLLVFSVMLTGKTESGKMRPLQGFDLIPTEIAGGIVLIICMLWWMLGVFLTRGRSVGAGIWIQAVFSGTEYLFGLWALLSAVRRLRARTLWTNSVTHGVLQGARAVYAAKLRTQRMMLIYLGFMVLNMTFLLFLGLPGILMSVVLNMAVWLYLALSAVGSQNVREGLRQISQGKLDYRIRTEVLTGESREMGEAVNEMGEGLQKAVDSMLKNERLRAELITNVSHDLKTPLTSIINYVDLLGHENLENERARGYVKILDQKAHRLKQLTEDLIEVSKISSGNVELHPVRLRLQDFLQQAAGEFEDRLEERSLEMVMEMPKEPVFIMADGGQLWRVFENLLGNIAKYARPQTKVYATLSADESAEIRFVNESEAQINVSAQELMERFTRGDQSRQAEGSGLGLSIAGSLTKLMGGSFAIELEDRMFSAILRFPLVRDTDT